MPADFKWFKEKTLGKTIILGLNTFKSIGEKPLPNRKHIILNNDPNFKVPEGCFVATSIVQAIELAKGAEEVMICGGASVYKQFLPLADKLYLTYIHHSFDGDTYFPEVNMAEWRETSREDHQPDDPPAPRPGVYFVYALHCSNGGIYIGQTQNLSERWKKHCNESGAIYTKQHNPDFILHYEEYGNRKEAVSREKWLKTGFGRKWLQRQVKSGRARQAGKNVYPYSFVVLERK